MVMATHQAVTFSNYLKGFHNRVSKRACKDLEGMSNKGLIFNSDLFKGLKILEDTNFCRNFHKKNTDGSS